MKKRLLALFLTAALATTAFVGCGTKDGETPAKEETTKTEVKTVTEEKKEDTTKTVESKTVKMFQFKVEISEPLDKMKLDLEKETGIKLDIETYGGGADYGAMLKAKFASNEYPDLFNNGGNNELDVWVDKLADLSDEPWVNNLAAGTATGMTKEGKLYGMPMNVEGYSFLYNVDLFAKAGITTLPTTVKELEAACEKLKGIGVTPFSSGYQEWWVLGLHNFNALLANQEDPDAFINSLKDGSADLSKDPLVKNWIDLLDLTVKYAQPNTLTVDYNTQVTEFALGASAIMQQGNWTQKQITELNPEINVAVMPMPIKDADNNKVLVGVPNNWVVYKESPVLKEAKETLDWMVSSETGKKYITDEFVFIPAFTNFDNTEGLGTIANSLQGYMADGNVLGWHFFKLPDGAGNEVGATMQAYIGGEYTREELMTKVVELMHEFAQK